MRFMNLNIRFNRNTKQEMPPVVEYQIIYSLSAFNYYPRNYHPPSLGAK